MDRQARNATAITAWRDEENWRIEDERRIFKESTRGDADNRLKSKLFLSLGKQKKRYINKKHPFRKIVDSVSSGCGRCRQILFKKNRRFLTSDSYSLNEIKCQ